MSKAFKGELTAYAEGVKYTLRMDLNAMAAFEDATGLPALEWSSRAEQGKVMVKDMITMTHCAMLRHHPDASRELAGDVISEDPELIQRLFLASAPKAGEVEEVAAPEK